MNIKNGVTRPNLPRKLIIQIPCLNEADTLAQTLADLPTSLDGIDVIERLIIDDGSTDNTAQIARDLGVEHIVAHSRNKGLAAAFSTGLKTALDLGADIIVNTDGDNQYSGEDIAKLIAPLIDKKADIVIGRRPIQQTKSFSRLKRALQHIGSQFVSLMSGTPIPDAPSGFRAVSADAAMRLNFFSKYTYTLEMLVQAGRSGLFIETVDISTNPPTRPSRLMKGMLSYIVRSVTTVVRIFIIYRPFRFFFFIGLLPFSAAMLLSSRWLYYAFADIGGGRVQSLLLATILFILAFLCWALGILSDLLSVNRRVLEELQYQQRKQIYDARKERASGS